MKRIKLTLGQAIVRFLDRQYLDVDGKEVKFVEGIWGIFGHGNVVGLGEAIENRNHSLKFYQGRNEQGMAHVAIAYAKQHRRQKIMAVTSSIGPGAANMVTAAATATVNRIPLLLLPGDVFACRQPDPVLQQLEQEHDLSLSVNDSFKPVCKFWDRITRPEQFISAAMNAMRVLTDPAETGAVCIALSQDVQGETYNYPVEFFEKRIHVLRRPTPEAREISALLKTMARKKKPLIIAGGGIAFSGAEETLLNFADRYNIPVAETQGGKGYLKVSHRLNLGTIGVTGTYAANRAAKDADMVLAIGTRLNDFITASKSAFNNPACEFASINLNGYDAHKLFSQPIIADAKATIAAISRINSSLKTKLLKKSSFGTTVQSYQKIWKTEVHKVYHTKLKKEYSQMRALGQLNLELLPKNAVVVAASGSLPGDLGRFWQTYATGGYHLEYGFSCMGYEVGGALGVKLAEPNREVYCLLGDGSYTLLHSELVTSIQEGVKINIILFDNNGFHCIDNLQTSQGIPSFGCEFRFRQKNTGRLTGGYVPVDYAANARSYGCEAWTATNEQELQEAFRSAKASKVSTLIDIKVGRKTMSEGYESWWRVGVPEISKNRGTVAKSQTLLRKKSQLRDY